MPHPPVFAVCFAGGGVRRVYIVAMFMSTITFRTAVGMVALYALAAVSGAMILVTQMANGRDGFGIITGAAVLCVFSFLAVRYARVASRLRRESPSEG